MLLRHFWLAGVVLVAVLVLLPFSFHAERHLETATRVEGSQAETVTQELATRFRSPFVDRVVLVIEGLPPADSDEGEQAVATIVEGLKDEPGVSGVVSYARFARSDFPGQGWRNLCSGGTRVDRGTGRIAGPQASRAGKLSSKSIAGPLSER